MSQSVKLKFKQEKYKTMNENQYDKQQQTTATTEWQAPV